MTAACGTGSGQPAQTSEPGTVSPQRTAGPSPTASPSSLGEPAQTTPGKIVVAPSASAYGPGQPIVAVISNGTSRVIYAEDLRTGCTIGILQRRVSDAPDGWLAVPDCGAERTAAVLGIGPGRGRTIVIDPAGLASMGSPLIPGTYRLAVAWRTAPRPEGVEEQRTFSAAFRVG